MNEPLQHIEVTKLDGDPTYELKVPAQILYAVTTHEAVPEGEDPKDYERVRLIDDNGRPIDMGLDQSLVEDQSNMIQCALRLLGRN